MCKQKFQEADDNLCIQKYNFNEKVSSRLTLFCLLNNKNKIDKRKKNSKEPLWDLYFNVKSKFRVVLDFFYAFFFFFLVTIYPCAQSKHTFQKPNITAWYADILCYLKVKLFPF